MYGGNIEKEVQTSGRAPAAESTMSETETAGAVLEDNEKQSAANGISVKILLVVKDASNSVSSGDRLAVQDAQSGFDAGRYIKITGNSSSTVSETAKKIRVTIAFESDRFSDYALVYRDTGNGSGSRNNNGGNGGSRDNSGAAPETQPTKDKEPKTGDASSAGLYATAAMLAGLAYLLVYFEDSRHGMTEKGKRRSLQRKLP